MKVHGLTVTSPYNKHVIVSTGAEESRKLLFFCMGEIPGEMDGAAVELVFHCLGRK